MKIRENLDALIEKHPEIYEAYSEFGKAIHDLGGPLDEKTRWLIKIAVSASHGLATPVAASCSSAEALRSRDSSGVSVAQFMVPAARSAAE